MEEYFRKMFTAEGTEMKSILAGVRQSITETQNEVLTTQVSGEEVHKALFSMNPDKAPGPDGFTPAFYQKCWSIVGEDVVATVRQFWQLEVIPDRLNDTVLVLIPKKTNPLVMGDLRPIALCNVL